MNSEWKELEIGDIASVIDPHPSHRAPKAVEDGFSFAGIGDIDEYGNINHRKARQVAEDSVIQQENSYKINNYSIGYGRVGTVGKVVKLRKQAYRYAISPTLAVINPKNNVEPKYIYYAVIAKDFNNQVLQRMSGTTRPAIGIQALRKIKVNLPPLHSQKKIAYILSTLDDKIELNRKMNQTLEDMSQALFKSWFVDFDPIHAKANATSDADYEKITKELGISREILDLFPDEFEESEFGMIPRGWTVESLNELTSKFATGLNPRKNFVLGEGNNYYVTIKNMSNQDVILNDKCDKVTDEALIKINNRSDLRKGDFLFSGIGTIGRVFYLHETPLNWNISESIFTIRVDSNKLTEQLLYLTLLGNKLQNFAQHQASGSVQKGIRMGDLKSFEVAIPNISIQQILSKSISLFIDKIKANTQEIKTLQKTRDTLLPKLLSGELDVSELDIGHVAH